MSRLSIALLGKPRLALDGMPITIPTARAIPLIAYLAIEGKSQSRETLANLLWADSSQTLALAALRTTLWRLKSAGLEDWISIEHDAVELNRQKTIDIDVASFRAQLDRCSTHGHPLSQICIYCTPALTGAVGLYQGDFMAGFNISRAPIFDDWRMQQSESLQALHLDALERLVRCHRTMGDFNLAIHYARRWLNYDRLNENANHQLLQLYLITGQRTAGISLYKHYKDALAHELDIKPAEDLTNLYKQLQTGQAAPLSDQKVKNPVFLIAEIENAAQYWAKAGDQKKEEILVTNLNILRDTAHRFGGRVIQKSDDSVTLFFENGQPLHCAVTIFMKIRKADWGPVGPPGVRMVVYSTYAEGDNPATFAHLTRAASALLSISWGGQVVFSDQTLKLLDIPSGAQVRDLGVHYVDNIEGTVHAYELVHPNLPQQEHPPLQSRTRQLVNFPILGPAFIGREQELQELEQLIKAPENRLISLVGPGGIGKTRLAVQFALETTKYFQDGVYFISLASIQDPDFIPIMLAEALKFNFYGPRNQAEQLGRYLHRMKVLLVIDNIEHLRLEGARHLATLLTHTHFLKILVTTRERLNMISEAILEVHGLPVPSEEAGDDIESYDSVRLFIHNAQKTFPRFSFKKDLPAIARICRQVDGIPLGILLASSWVRVFSCPDIADEIQSDIDFLSSTAPDIDPRHRSLRAVFDHSWDLLSPGERSCLQRLSIFSAPFTTQAAQEICGATQLALAVFSDKSLLIHRQDNHYEMLSTFHLYARNHLQQISDEHQATTKKYCEYYATYCSQKYVEITTPLQRKAVDNIISESENIRTAWSWMVESDRWDLIDLSKELMVSFHIIVGKSIEARELFNQALDKLNRLRSPSQDLIRAGMLMRASYMDIRSGFVTQGLPGLYESLEIFKKHNSIWDMVEALLYLAEAHRVLHKYPQAKIYIEEAISALQQNLPVKDNRVLAFTAHCQSVLGLVSLDLGEFEEAQRNLDESLAVTMKLGIPYGMINPLMGLGKLAFTRGEFVQARDLYLKAMETAINIYDQHGMALLHNNLAAIYEVIVNFSEAFHHTNAALRLSRETGDRRLTAVITNNLAFHQMKHFHQPTEAIRTYQECMELFSEIGDLRGITYTCYDISRAYLMVGLVDEAQSYCLNSLHTAITLDSIPLILHALHGFVTLFAHLNQTERALRLCYLIINHPDSEPDTKNRAVVSRLQLETALPAEVIQAACQWAQSTNLQDAIDRIIHTMGSDKNQMIDRQEN